MYAKNAPCTVKIIKTKSEHNGLIAYRDYQIINAIESGDDISLQYPGGQRIIKNTDIRSQIVDIPPARIEHISKFDGKSYKMMYFSK